MSRTLGIDCSTKAVDLVFLDEDSQTARWHSIPLPKGIAGLRTIRWTYSWAAELEREGYIAVTELSNKTLVEHVRSYLESEDQSGSLSGSQWFPKSEMASGSLVPTPYGGEPEEPHSGLGTCYKVNSGACGSGAWLSSPLDAPPTESHSGGR